MPTYIREDPPLKNSNSMIFGDGRYQAIFDISIKIIEVSMELGRSQKDASFTIRKYIRIWWAKEQKMTMDLKQVKDLVP